jgi:hypothetical protein
MTQVEATTKQTVKITVDYLPATEAFHAEYARETVLETVRSDAMGFFGVADRQERDTYRYYLEHAGRRITDTSVTLGSVVQEHAHAAHFNLVEEITPGRLA